MRKRLLLLSVLVILVIAGLIGGMFTGPLQQALMASMTSVGMMQSQVPKQTAPARSTPTPMPTNMPMDNGNGQINGNANQMQANTILAQDTFQRANQTFWGIASNGQQWQADANSQQAFSISNKMGQIAGMQGSFNAVLGAPTKNAEVDIHGSINQFADGSNFGVVLRWIDDNNWYKAYIDGKHLILLKRVDGHSVTIGSVPFAAQAGQMYDLRFQAMGAILFTSVWPADQQPPANWMLVTSDNSLENGVAGIRVVVQATTVTDIASFEVVPAAIGDSL
jgi:hypothetical protein